MTIRILQQWNGYSPDQIVSNLSGTEETRLIGLGFATADLDGANDGVLVDAKLTTTPSGGVYIPMPDGSKHWMTPQIVRVSLTADQVLTSGSVKSFMSWGVADYDTTNGSSWTAGSPTKLVVPAGYSFARVVSQLRFTDPADETGVPAGQNIVNHIQKNGTTTVPGMGLQDVARGTTAGAMTSQVEFEWHPVVPGDYFETYAVNVSAGNLAVVASGRSWFYMELR